MITKRRLNISRGIKPWIVLLCLSLIVVWACRKEQKIDLGSDPSEKIDALSKWYEKQLIPTEDAKSFSDMNNPVWESTKIVQKGDTILYTTLVYANNKITRELQTRYHDGIYSGVVRQYNFTSSDSLLTATLTVNGRLIDFGYFDKNKNYTLLSLAGNRNLVLMGTETKDGGTLPTPVVTRPGPTDPKNPDPDIPPTGTPSTPTFPSGGGVGSSTGDNSLYSPIAWNGDISTMIPGDVSCASFKFSLPKNNRMATRVKGIPPVTFTQVGGGVKKFAIRNLIIDVPSKLADNRTTFDQTDAAKATAEAINITVKTLGMIYGQTGKFRTAMESTYERDFITTFNKYLQANIPGARVSVDLGTRPDVTSNSTLIFDGLFDGLFGGDDC